MNKTKGSIGSQVGEIDIEQWSAGSFICDAKTTPLLPLITCKPQRLLQSTVVGGVVKVVVNLTSFPIKTYLKLFKLSCRGTATDGKRDS